MRGKEATSRGNHDQDTTQVDPVPSFVAGDATTAPLDELFDAEETGQTSGNIWMSLTSFARRRKVSTARAALRQAQPLGKALTTRVRLFGRAWPLWSLFALAIVGLNGATVGVAWVAWGQVVSEAEPSPPASALVVLSGATTAALPSPEEPSVAERAANGDPAAMAELEAREPTQLDPNEILALFKGTRAQRRRALAAVGERLRSNPESLDDPETLAPLRRELDDPEFQLQALQVVAHLPASAGPDLLYALREDPSRSDETRGLARQLLQTLAVRQNASSALTIALELEEVSDCERAHELVERAQESADHRSIDSIMRLTRMRGCGADGLDDCFPCLRHDNKLREALDAIGQRSATRASPAAPSARAEPEDDSPRSSEGDDDSPRSSEDPAAAPSSPASSPSVTSPPATREPGF